MSVAAVVFDLDGVLIDSERVWAAARKELVHETGGRWPADAQARMMGMNSREWSRFMRDEFGVPMEPAEISGGVVERLERRYREHLPLLPHAREAVKRLAARWPLAVASSSNRPLIDLVLDLAGLTDCFRVTISSEEVARGKPAPDVYLDAARQLAVEPMPDTNCNECGAPLPPKRRRFCSVACSDANYNQRRRESRSATTADQQKFQSAWDAYVAAAAERDAALTA